MKHSVRPPQMISTAALLNARLGLAEHLPEPGDELKREQAQAVPGSHAALLRQLKVGKKAPGGK